METTLTLGKRCEILRLCKGLTPQQVNKAVYKSTSWCGQLEGGKTGITLPNALALSSLYGVTLNQLLGLEPVSITINPA